MPCICISQQIHQGRQYRITDLSREHTEELTEKIQRLIDMADCTYFEQKRISRSFEEEITQIKRQGKILRTTGSLHKSTGSSSNYLKSTTSEKTAG
jgi:phage gpG-like protein